MLLRYDTLVVQVLFTRTIYRLRTRAPCVPRLRRFLLTAHAGLVPAAFCTRLAPVPVAPPDPRFAWLLPFYPLRSAPFARDPTRALYHHALRGTAFTTPPALPFTIPTFVVGYVAVITHTAARTRTDILPVPATRCAPILPLHCCNVHGRPVTHTPVAVTGYHHTLVRLPTTRFAFVWTFYRYVGRFAHPLRLHSCTGYTRLVYRLFCWFVTAFTPHTFAVVHCWLRLVPRCYTHLPGLRLVVTVPAGLVYTRCRCLFILLPRTVAFDHALPIPTVTTPILPPPPTHHVHGSHTRLLVLRVLRYARFHCFALFYVLPVLDPSSHLDTLATVLV